MTSPFNPDWYAATHRTGRDLRWYLDRAEQGDADASERALEMVRDSLTPRAMKETGGELDPVLHAFLLQAAAQVLAPKKRRGGQRKELAEIQREWWLCVELHRRCQELGRLGDQLLAQDVIDDESTGPATDFPEPVPFGADQLLKRYRAWRDEPGDPLGAFIRAQPGHESPDSTP